MTESRNAILTRAAIKAVNDADFDSVEAMVSENVIVDVPFAALGMPERSLGRDGFIVGMRFVPTIFSTFALTIGDLYDCPADDVVIFEQTSEGTFALDGSRYGNRYLMLFAFKDDKITRWCEYYDSRVMTEKMSPILSQLQKS